MDIRAYALVAAISIVVIGGYISILMRRGKRRDEFFKNAGFHSPDHARQKNIIEVVNIKSRGAVSLWFGSKVYVSSDACGDFIVCDLVASVGVARYAGFSKITVLGFYGDIGVGSSFLLRKAHPMETPMELRGALSLGRKWYVWCSGMQDEQVDELVERVEAFGSAAIVRKNGSVLSLYFLNQYLGEKEIEEIMPEWRAFCQSYL